MDTNAAQRMALDLMAQHGVSGAFHFKFDRAVTRFGLCRYPHQGKPGFISLSKPLTEAADVETVRQTILHEVAHAMLGPGYGHGIAWKRTARSIGYNGARQVRAGASEQAVIDSRKRTFTVICKRCDSVLGQVTGMRKPTRYNKPSIKHRGCGGNVYVVEA